MDYLEIAKRTMNFINTRKRKGPEGIFWSLEDAAKGRPIYYDEICMYAGASGILCFLLGLYDVTKDSPWVEQDPVGILYKTFEQEKSEFDKQVMMEMADLYQVLYQKKNIINRLLICIWKA